MNTPNHPNKKSFYGILGLLWLLAVVIGYFYTHKPFTSNEIVGPLVALWRIAIIFGLISLAGGAAHAFLVDAQNNRCLRQSCRPHLGLASLPY